MDTKLALLIVDMQNDFSENGSLPVPGASEIVPIINKIIGQMAARSIVMYSKDWHPVEHCSFANCGGEWPSHCIQGSKGAELIDGLDIPSNAFEIRKGYEVDKDSYSAFGGTVKYLDKIESLDDFLKMNNVNSLYVMGLTTDYCVKDTALDAKGLGYRTIFVENASKGVSKESVEEAINEMAKSGITFLNIY